MNANILLMIGFFVTVYNQAEAESQTIETISEILKNIILPHRLKVKRDGSVTKQSLTSQYYVPHTGDSYMQTGCNTTFNPSILEEIVEGEQADFSLFLKCPPGQYRVMIVMRVEDPANLRIVSNTTVMLSDTNNNVTVTVEAINFGRTHILFNATYIDILNNQTTWLEIPAYELSMVFTQSSLSTIYTLVLGVLIIVYKFGFGCKCHLPIIIDILKKPVAPAVGFGCQFLLMAPLALGIAKLFELDSVAGLGLVAIGACPGGGASNVFALLLDLNVELSLTMSSISTLAAMGMTPFWIWLLGPVVTGDNTDIVIPVENVLLSLLLIILPVIPGLILVNYKQKWAHTVTRMLKPMTAIMGVVFLGMGLIVYWEPLMTLDGNSILASLVLPLCGYLLGIGFGKLFCLGWVPTFTIGLETGFQNYALALIMLEVSLPRPESDIAGALPMVYTFLSCAMPALVWIGYVSYKLYRKHVKDDIGEGTITIEEPDWQKNKRSIEGSEGEEIMQSDCSRRNSTNSVTQELPSQNIANGQALGDYDI